jgi:hypothetical protein
MIDGRENCETIEKAKGPSEIPTLQSLECRLDGQYDSEYVQLG